MVSDFMQQKFVLEEAKVAQHEVVPCMAAA
jgi:hypothetical protein